MDRRTYQTSAGDWRYFHPDRYGEGEALWSMVELLQEAKDRGFYGIKVGDGVGLKYLQYAVWTLLLDPTLQGAMLRGDVK